MSPSRRLGTRPAIVAVLVVLAVVNLTRSTVVPGGAHLAFNLVNGLVVMGIAIAAGLDRNELGCGREPLGSGLRWGLAAAALVTAVVVLAGIATVAVSSGTGPFDDPRADIGVGSLVVRAGVVIPLGTVLVEELVFRGVVFGLLRRLYVARRAIVIGALLFGGWHVFPASRDVGDPAVVLVGTFAATTAAGLGFGWLRHRTGSLAAPVVAHVGTNSVPLVVAWLVQRSTCGCTYIC